MKTRTAGALALTATLLVGATPTTTLAGGGGLVDAFARSTFNLNEWTLESFTKPYEGTEGGAVFIVEGNSQPLGSCLELRYFTPVPSRLTGIAFLNEASWVPALRPISDLSLSLAGVQIDAELETTQGGAFYIEQAGRYYIYDMGFGLDDVEIFAVNGVTASDFSEITFDDELPPNPLSNPDFSANGAPLRIGFGRTLLFFITLNTNLKVGLDNFSVQVHYSNASCVGDLNNDNAVDLADLNILLAAFGTSKNGDIDNNGAADLQDLNILLANFGDLCL